MCRCIVPLPITSPVPLPSMSAVWVAVDRRVRLPLALRVSLLTTIPFTDQPDETMVVTLPAATVRLLKVAGEVPPRVCTVPPKIRVPPLWVNDPLFTQLFC